MKKEAVVVLTALMFSTAPMLAGEIDSFTVAGTVHSMSCLQRPWSPSEPGPLCTVMLEVAVDPSAYLTEVGCFDPAVAEACETLRPRDVVLISGIEYSGTKQATRVALLMHETNDCVIAPFDKGVAHGRLWVRFEEMIEDSRCPVDDVTCVWAGRAIISISLWYEKTFVGTYKLTLGEGAGPDRMEVGKYFIRLAEVLPLPRTDGLPIDPADCSCVLQVVEAALSDDCDDQLWCPQDGSGGRQRRLP